MIQFMKYLSLSIPGSNGTPMQIDSGLPQGVPTGGLFDTGNRIISVFLELAIVIAILFAAFSIIQGGINIITSEGDKKKFQSGRDRVTFAIVGLIVVFMSFFMVNFLGKFFGVDLIGKLHPTSSPAPQLSQCQAPRSLSCYSFGHDLEGVWDDSIKGNYSLLACDSTGFCTPGVQKSNFTGYVYNLRPETYSLRVTLESNPNPAICSAPSLTAVAHCTINP